MSQLKHELINANDEDIRSSEGSEWTLETASIGTIGDGNAQENESTSMTALLEVPLPIYYETCDLKMHHFSGQSATRKAERRRGKDKSKNPNNTAKT
jgi:hypothetical protein